MKILAVRGKNLASLAGHFEVDFAKPPLDRAGLIAITGPTGAGKTTLLDAMCLALFDRTPRFANRGGVVIGGEGDDPNLGIKANDVRGILRHGAVEGWAEVDFLGLDERRWRARWEVRRARGRADGRIQQQTMQLIDPIGERVVAGDRKGDVLAAIEARLGLDFDQFRRSVLLAQGEFAAFLEASGGERAELLERMTGTGLYRQLGRAAYERAKQAEAELALIHRERATLALLADEDRAALEHTIAARKAAAAELERGRSGAEAALRWYLREDELIAALRAATAEAERATTAEAALGETATLLARVERVAGIRERIAARERVAAELDERRRDLEFVRGDLEIVEAQLRELRTKLARCDEGRVRAREQRRRLAPQLDRARELDGRIAATAAERERTAAKRAAARAQLDAGEAQLAQLDAALVDAQARLAQLDAEREAAAGLAPLSREWSLYKSQLQQQLAALERRDRLRRRVAELEPRRDRCEREVGQAKAELKQVGRRRDQARSRLAKIERELGEGPSLAELRHRQQTLERSRERATLLRRLFETAEQAKARLRELEGERRDRAVERDHRSRERARVEVELREVELAFDEAQRGLSRLEAVRDLITHRADLRPGEACPLCGATEHPAATEAAPVDAVVEAQRERVRELLRRRDDLQREQGEHQSHIGLANHRLAVLLRLCDEGEREREQAQVQWSELLAGPPLLPEREDREVSEVPASEQLSLLGASGEPGVPAIPATLDHPGVDAALWVLEDELEQRSLALARDRREVDARVEKQRDLVARREQAEREFEDRRKQSDEVSRELEAIVRELDNARFELEQLATELAQRELELAALGQDPRSSASAADVRADHGRGSAAELGESGSQDGRRHEPGSGAGEQGFSARLEQRGAALISELEAAVLEFRAREGERERIRDELRTAEARRAELGSAHAARRERCEQLAAELALLDATLAEQREARATELGGRPVAELVRELEAAVELADRDHDAAKDELGKVEVAHGRGRTQLHALTEQVEALERGLAEARRALAQAEAEVGVDAAELLGLLAREELWREGWASEARATIAAARAERERCEAIVGERERVLAGHRERERPQLEREAAERSRAELEQASEVLRRELFELEHRLRRDSEDRAAAAELAPRLAERERAAAIWGRLRDAIGSATGDKFQKFAQSLTLELLLTQANAQLRELKPRYKLDRVPKHDLELQLIDHDLGDEVRSIRGLSGGEKFLVSLALALALASLSAEDCRIDSLFIDEGFGTLDPHSLDVAVSTLDTLQAEGRQIGVISHVPGLAERVGVEIRVEPVSSGRSRVRVIEPRASAGG